MPKTPLTIAVLASACLLHVLYGPGSFAWPDTALARYVVALSQVLRHGDIGHLMGNGILLAAAGAVVEPQVSFREYARLVMLSVLVATTAEWALGDRPFSGMSGISLGVAVFGVLRWSNATAAMIWLALITLGLALEIQLASQSLAVYAHAGGAAAGIGLAMFSKIFGAKGPRLVAMEARHHAHVLDIIAETDEDDATEAHAGFQDDGYEGMFVLVDGSDVLGVTGAHLAENSDDVAWLSWTYLTTNTRGEGLGQIMLDGLLGQLNQHGVRKIFIATSDYAEDGEMIYADAMAFYRSLGAEEEMRVPDYHARGEAKIVYGLVNPGIEPLPAPEEEPITGVTFTRATPAPESDGGFGLDWDLTGTGVEGLARAEDEARENGARAVFVALPSDASAIAAAELEQSGFACAGRLQDYYAVGLDEVWWSKTIN